MQGSGPVIELAVQCNMKWGVVLAFDRPGPVQGSPARIEHGLLLPPDTGVPGIKVKPAQN